MRPVSSIQIEAERRRFGELAFRNRTAFDNLRVALTEAQLARIARLIDRYRLTEETK